MIFFFRSFYWGNEVYISVNLSLYARSKTLNLLILEHFFKKDGHMGNIEVDEKSTRKLQGLYPFFQLLPIIFQRTRLINTHPNLHKIFHTSNFHFNLFFSCISANL